MTPPRPASRPVVWLSVIPAALAGIILFDVLLAIGAALDWALLGLFDAPQPVIIAVGVVVAIASFALAVKFSLQAYRAELDFK
ncbi:hypothetical protein ACFOW6_17610 [Fodinicurvata halophila]|uniref:Uncharacterized protein n=1 Tax=Fodinicurvata halophila TaxID=1419723 RepID=A0ABV8UQH0_9PROT